MFVYIDPSTYVGCEKASLLLRLAAFNKLSDHSSTIMSERVTSLSVSRIIAGINHRQELIMNLLARSLRSSNCTVSLAFFTLTFLN